MCAIQAEHKKVPKITNAVTIVPLQPNFLN